MKLTLFSKEQIALFSFISKDLCSLNIEKSKFNKINEMKEFMKDKTNLAKLIVKYVEELNKKEEEEVNEMDRKLIDMLHDEFKNNIMAKYVA